MSSAPRAMTAPSLPGWRRQSDILADRYLAVLLGDLQTLLLLIAQAPVIAGLCVVVWGSIERDTTSLYFVLALTSVWFGCINACREIVKERALLERERLFGLSTMAYVLSKARVLIALDLIQIALLLGIVEWQVGLRGGLAWQALSLLLCAAAGTGLGLLISAFTHRQERAVAAVPLLILPQILFSEFAIPRELFGGLMEVLERLMIVRWGYEIFIQAAATEVGYVDIIIAVAVLVVMTAALHVAAAMMLRLGSAEDFL